MLHVFHAGTTWFSVARLGLYVVNIAFVFRSLPCYRIGRISFIVRHYIVLSSRFALSYFLDTILPLYNALHTFDSLNIVYFYIKLTCNKKYLSQGILNFKKIYPSETWMSYNNEGLPNLWMFGKVVLFFANVPFLGLMSSLLRFQTNKRKKTLRGNPLNWHFR